MDDGSQNGTTSTEGGGEGRRGALCGVTTVKVYYLTIPENSVDKYGHQEDFS